MKNEDDDFITMAVAGILYSIAVTAAYLVIVVFGLSGCAVPVEHRLPQVDEAISVLQQPVCPKLAPIPASMSIEIDGNKVDVDDNGDAFIRQYVAVRACQK